MAPGIKKSYILRNKKGLLIKQSRIPVVVVLGYIWKVDNFRIQLTRR